MAATENQARRLVERVQELQDLLDSRADAEAREIADALVSAVVQMYGAGLERILVVCSRPALKVSGSPSDLTEDSLVATLLLIHDLHPVPLEDRVQGALESVRPYMESHGGNVELLSLEDGVARIHLRGSCSDCSASSVTLELAIKQALEEAAPDLLGLEVEGVAPQMTGGLSSAFGDRPGGDLPGHAFRWPRPPATGLELPIVMAPASPALRRRGRSRRAASLVRPRRGRSRRRKADGRRGRRQPLVIANVEGTLLAYHDSCASCGGPLRAGELTEGALACPACQRSFFLPRAGRSLDADVSSSSPVPLLREQGRVKVALQA